MTARSRRAPAGEAAPAVPGPAPMDTPDTPLPSCQSGPSRAARAVRAAQIATRLENRPAFDVTDDVLKQLEARHSREEAQQLLRPDRELVRGAGEVAQRPAPDSVRGAFLVNTLELPNMIGVEASEQRTDDLMHLDILAPGLDAAETAQAGNSLEKMLCHQMAAAHHAAMRLIGDAIGPNTFTRLPTSGTSPSGQCGCANDGCRIRPASSRYSACERVVARRSSSSTSR